MNINDNIDDKTNNFVEDQLSEFPVSIEEIDNVSFLDPLVEIDVDV